MPSAAALTSTDQVAPRERVAFWADWVHRLFGGLQSDLYGDCVFDGRMVSAHAGDVVLTRLEANRHRVQRRDRACAQRQPPARAAVRSLSRSSERARAG